MNGALLSSKNMGWCTPADFFSELDQEFHFNLDPAATDKSAKCARYFTPADDGLKADWGGCRVFCNPPYGRQITDWVRKGYEESKKPGTLVVMLIPARTDTSYFHDYGNVLEATRSGNELHPTQKPVEILEKLLDNTQWAEGVLDTFGGSGTTLIAAESVGQQAFLMEMEPAFVDTIVRRYIRTTGKTTGIRLIRKGAEQPREVFEGIFE